jgi:citrate lyase beta subunit
MLSVLLSLEGIEAIDGFVLPKFGLENAERWLEPLMTRPFAFMPSIEGKELFNQQELISLADRLMPFQNRIPAIRFGLEDMLRQLGMLRDCQTPLYGLAAPLYVIGSVISVFKPKGFNVSGGVYKCYSDMQGFRSEVEEDLRQGLLGKTVIHPSQIDVIEAAYRVSEEEKCQAETLVRSSSNVTGFRGIMMERPTQLPWAYTILRRAAIYGVGK